MYSCKEIHYIGILSSCIITGSIRTEKATVFYRAGRCDL